MKHLFTIAIISFLISPMGVEAASPPDPNEWTPDATTVTQVDAMAMQFDLPKEFGAISGYARYYWGTARNGHRLIEGILVSPSVRRGEGKVPPQPVNIVPENTAPDIADGGCMLVNVEYDVEIGKLLRSDCNPNGPLPPPPPPSNSH